MINFLNANLSFGSLKSQKRLGEKIMKEYRKEYPIYFHSDTFIDYLSSKIKQDNPDLKIRLQKVVDKYSSEIDSTRSKYQGAYETWDDYISCLKHATLGTKAANCGEQARLCQDIFLKKGEEAHCISMELNHKDSGNFYNNHAFVVIGMKKNADITSPNTWGNDAVVVDPWSNVVMGAKDAIDYFSKILKFKLDYHKITYEKDDLIDIDRYIKSQKINNKK